MCYVIFIIQNEVLYKSNNDRKGMKVLFDEAEVLNDKREMSEF